MESYKYYGDIIELPRHISKRHTPMNIQNRAAQFAPFSALTGHNDEVMEKTRLTEDFIYLDESQIDNINQELNYIIDNFSSIESIFIKYFIKDEKKQGGRYESKRQGVKKIDTYNNILILQDNTKINFENILKIYVLKDRE